MWWKAKDLIGIYRELKKQIIDFINGKNIDLKKGFEFDVKYWRTTYKIQKSILA